MSTLSPFGEICQVILSCLGSGQKVAVALSCYEIQEVDEKDGHYPVPPPYTQTCNP